MLKLASLLAIALLAGCAMLPQYGRITHQWNGTAFGDHYEGICAVGLRSGDRHIGGEWVWPNMVFMSAHACDDPSRRIRVLAHEIAHLTVCGSNEACAVSTARRWLDDGTTIQELGWRQP